MSGSPGNTSGGTQGGRTPRGRNEDVVARHGRGGAEATPNPDASTAARATRTGRNDSAHADPDAPEQESEQDEEG